MKRFLSTLFILFLISQWVSIVSAATVTFQNGKTQLNSPDEEYTVDVTLSINAANDTKYYLRGLFYKVGTSGNYCGYTWNGISWFNGPYGAPAHKNLLPITITDNTWSGQVKAKIENEDNACKDSGDYNFKILRYTDGGSSNQDTQTEQVVHIIIPTPTPTAIPTETPTKTPTPSKTPTPTDVPPTKLPTSRPTTTASLSIAKKSPTPTRKDATSPTKKAVLGDRIEEKEPSIEPRPTALVKEIHNSPVNVGTILILAGSIFLVACGILTVYMKRKGV